VTNVICIKSQSFDALLSSDFETNLILNRNINESLFGCDFSCKIIDEFGPPPDLILSIPPPPLTPSLQQLLNENQSLKGDDNGCNFCHVFYSPTGQDNDFFLPNPGVKTDESWLSLLVFSVLGLTAFGALFILFLVKCKKYAISFIEILINSFPFYRWKIFPVSDSCPIFPESFLGGHKTAPPPCSPSDSCISPVVNEKPQSVITDSPTKKTSIPSKYWRRTNDLSHGGRMANGIILDRTTEIDEYSGCPDAPSCTSSPVYAELDAVGINHSQAPTPILITGPSQSISPYAVHTYTEVSDAVRMAALGSSSALLPDASYDNAAYLPTSNSDHYHGRSLRRHRAATLAQLGSATPLLATHHNINGSPSINYLTGGRPQKKPRQPYAHPLTRANMIRTHEELETTTPTRHLQGRRHHGLYGDISQQSPTLSTFRLANIPYNLRDQPKRPLPPVPGVRL
ncbi:hypothetical protein B4U79_09141, partial [Dinothrombium tinctorium]